MTTVIPFIRRSGTPKKVAIALSGGVDSSVVAYLMKQACSSDSHQSHPHELIAVHMSNWNSSDEEDPHCTKDRDWKDAQAVASQLGIPLHPTSFAADYWTQVFEPFTADVERGIRPNPDVHCNRYIKFGALKDYVQSKLQANVLATGHYARLWDRSGTQDGNPYHALIEEMLQHDPSPPTWIRTWGRRDSNLTPLLLAARDRSKCQAFFLSSVPGKAFCNVVFPLGDLIKKNQTINLPLNHTDSKNLHADKCTFHNDVSAMTVREIAENAQLPTAGKKESMGICFVGKRPGGFADFIDQYFPTEDTNSYNFYDIDTGKLVVNEFGNSTTHHMVYTRGQRAKISGASAAYFVVKTHKESMSIWVCQGTHHPALYSDTIYIKELNWIAGDIPPPLQQHLSEHKMLLSSSHPAQTQRPVLHGKCRIRNLQPLVACQITYDPDSRLYIVQTETPLRAITPGQHCAIYVGEDGLVCLGGGTIKESGPTYHDLGREMPQVSHIHPSGHNDWSIRDNKHQQLYGVT
jgi:tRNA U34 2-thiouridine synthase MnmA/TrmU